MAKPRCGDFGGKNWDETPCKKICNGLCKAHREARPAVKEVEDEYYAVLVAMEEQPTRYVKKICEEMGVTYNKFYSRVFGNPKLLAKYEEIRELRKKTRREQFDEDYYEFLFGPNATATDRVWYSKNHMGYKDTPQVIEVSREDDKLLADLLGVPVHEVRTHLAGILNDPGQPN